MRKFKTMMNTIISGKRFSTFLQLLSGKILFPKLIICLLFIFPLKGFTQTSQKDLLSQKWKYLGVEEFGVLHSPDSTQKNDWLSLMADGTYEWMQKGKTTSGTWKLNESAKIIVFTDSKTKKSLNYNLKSISENDLTIEYQTPDLVRTRYRYHAVKE